MKNQYNLLAFNLAKLEQENREKREPAEQSALWKAKSGAVALSCTDVGPIMNLRYRTRNGDTGVFC